MGRRPREETPVYSRLAEARAELADAVGVHYQTIGYIERGEYNPSLSLALHLATALDAEVTDLFSTKPFRRKGGGGER
ncbi:MAG: helix-turn-helix transcriptional regulator [Actinomycetota bacterium]